MPEYKKRQKLYWARYKNENFYLFHFPDILPSPNETIFKSQMLSVRRGPLARALGRSKSVILRNRSSICNTLLALEKMIQIRLSLLVKVLY